MHNNYHNFPQLNYTINGIKNLNFNIHTKINLSLSLESLFKIINSTYNMPFIKYNPGKINYRQKNKFNSDNPFNVLNQINFD